MVWKSGHRHGRRFASSHASFRRLGGTLPLALGRNMTRDLHQPTPIHPQWTFGACLILLTSCGGFDPRAEFWAPFDASPGGNGGSSVVATGGGAGDVGAGGS